VGEINFVKEEQCVLYEVRTGLLNTNEKNSRLTFLKHTEETFFDRFLEFNTIKGF